MTDTLSQRKTDHIDLTAHGDVGFRSTTTLLEEVQLVHDALPELAYDEVDLRVRIMGKELALPILIASMTGGTERAQRINLELAALAEERGLAMGLGSQRAMLLDPAQTSSYRVRSVAPSVLLLGNIGGVQAAQASTEQLREMVGAISADALCVHLNPAMELIQVDGDRDFRGVLAAIERLVEELDVPVIAKETGCGLSRRAGQRLRAAGVQHVDVSGAGGTSWVAVEAERAASEQRAVGQSFREWGIPTAASVALMRSVGFQTVFATGGVSSGLDVACSLALGASAAGIARPLLQAYEGAGASGLRARLDAIERELRTALLLVGAGDCAALARAPRILGPNLRAWVATADE